MGMFTVDKESLNVNGQPVEAHAIAFSGASPAAGATSRFVVASGDAHLGCTAEDYEGLEVAGAVVMVDRGECLLAAECHIGNQTRGSRTRGRQQRR